MFLKLEGWGETAHDCTPIHACFDVFPYLQQISIYEVPEPNTLTGVAPLNYSTSRGTVVTYDDNKSVR